MSPMNDLSEKYRPSSFEELLGQEDVVTELLSYVANHRSSNLAFVGPSGCGKSSAAMILAKSLVGDKGMTIDFKHLHADSCSLENVAKSINEANAYRPLVSSQRVLLIDDFHLMKRTIREKLRNAIEVRISNRVLVVTCENQKDWSSALKSRFRTILFSRLSKEVAKVKIKAVLKSERMPGHPPRLEELGITKSKHYNLREVVNALEGFIDRGAVEQSAEMEPKGISPSRIAAGLVVTAICNKYGIESNALEAHSKLIQDESDLEFVRHATTKMS